MDRVSYRSAVTDRVAVRRETLWQVQSEAFTGRVAGRSKAVFIGQLTRMLLP